jgi:flagellar motor switch protein FliG
LQRKKHSSEIESLVATLAGRQHDSPKPTKQLTGPERAAVLMLALGEQHGAKIWNLLDDDDLRQLSIVMSTLGNVDAQLVESCCWNSSAGCRPPARCSATTTPPSGCCSNTCRRSGSAASWTRIRGPAGRNMWEKLANVQEEVLANYLKNEYPQTVAVVLSKLRPEHAARVLAILPEDLSLDVVNRMLKMEAVQKEVLERVEQTLRTEFMSSLSQTRRRDAHEVMAEIFNNFDRQTETRFMTSLEGGQPREPPSASRR